MAEQYPLDRDFLLRLAALVVLDPGFGLRVLEAIEPDLIPFRDAAVIFSVLKAHVRDGGDVPDRVLGGQLLLQRYHVGAITEEVYGKVTRLYKRIWEASPLQREIAQRALTDLIMEAEILTALDDAYKLVKDKKHRDVFARFDMAQARTRLLDIGDMGCHLNANLPNFFSDMREGKARVDRMPLGVAPLDRALKGGLGRGELGALLGAQKSGKSQGLGHIAASTVLAGKNAVYVTCELSELEVKMRFVSNLTGVRIDRLEAAEKIAIDSAEERMERILKRVNAGHFIVKQYPGGTASVRDVENYLQDVRRYWGISPDVLVVDYADELNLKGLSAKGDTYAALGSVYTDLRALGSRPGLITHTKGGHNCAVWTASQVQRGAVGKEVLEFKDVAESILKASKVDLMIGLCQTEDEVEADLMRLYVAICRFAPWPFEIGPFPRDYLHGRMIKLDATTPRFENMERYTWANASENVASAAIASLPQLTTSQNVVWELSPVDLVRPSLASITPLFPSWLPVPALPPKSTAGTVTSSAWPQNGAFPIQWAEA